MNPLSICRSNIDSRIFACLTMLSGEEGSGCVTLNQLASIVGLSKQQVRDSLNRLKTIGLCSLENRGRQGIFFSLFRGAVANDMDSGQTATPPKAPKETRKITLSKAKDNQPCPAPAPTSDPPSVDKPKPEKEKYFLSRKEAVAVVHDITTNTDVQEAAEEWIAMRYAKRGEHRLTEKAIRGAFQKLRNMGYNTQSQAMACFAQSVEHMWDGLFEVKE